ncbi:unnamed protein product [Effrenium voratum]|uniref:Uncharacterized protein n=1 Tax=Effrenium voratum TaxID=2562239 RepID=A0AA36IR79_9DINO|nr:unnamed protein product [Effrenium voratum]
MAGKVVATLVLCGCYAARTEMRAAAGAEVEVEGGVPAVIKRALRSVKGDALLAASAKLGNVQLSQKAKTAGTIESTEESDDKGVVGALKEVNGEDVVNFGKAAFDMGKEAHNGNVEDALKQLPGVVQQDQILTAAAAFLATRTKIMLLQGSAVKNTDEVKQAAADFQSDIEGMKKVLADFQDLRLTHTLGDAYYWIESVAWAPDGRLAAGSRDKKVRVYDEDLRLTHTLADADWAIYSVAWAPDGRLAAGGLDNKVRVYDESCTTTR